MKIDFMGLLQAVSKLHPQYCTSYGLTRNKKKIRISKPLSRLPVFAFLPFFFSLILLMSKGDIILARSCHKQAVQFTSTKICVLPQQ